MLPDKMNKARANTSIMSYLLLSTMIIYASSAFAEAVPSTMEKLATGMDNLQTWHTPVPNAGAIVTSGPAGIPNLDSCDSCMERPRPLPALIPINDHLFIVLVLPQGDPAALEKGNPEWVRAELRKTVDPDAWAAYTHAEEIINDRLSRPRKYDKPPSEVTLYVTLNMTYLRPPGDEKQQIRDLWTKTFGVDVWYPYFKVKEVEDWFKERISFRIKKMKCKPKIQKDMFVYVCRKTF